MRQISARLVHSSSSVLAAFAIMMLFSCSSGGGDPYVHLATAIDCIGKADAIMDQATTGPGPHTITKADYKQRYEYFKTALKEAKLIDFASMNKDYATLGDHCQNELKKSLEWILEGEKKNDLRIKMAGQALLAQFIEWYQSHKDEIQKRAED